MKLTKTDFGKHLREKFFENFESKYKDSEVELGEGGRWYLITPDFEFVEFSPNYGDFSTSYIKWFRPTEKQQKEFEKNQQHEKDLKLLWESTKAEVEEEYFQFTKKVVMEEMGYTEEDMEWDHVEEKVNSLARDVICNKLGL